MKQSLLISAAALVLVSAAIAQTDTTPPADAPPQTAAPAPDATLPSGDQPPPAEGAAAPADADAAAAEPAGSPKHAVLELRALDKITGKATILMAPLNEPVHFATLTVTARTCYSTPPSETPETSAFLQIDDHRPDQPERRVFSGWMYASSPGLNSMQHPLYDVWVIKCITSEPGQAPSAEDKAPVKPVSPDAGTGEPLPVLPEGAGQ